jgi:SAM-dependent methyltransferase
MAGPVTAPHSPKELEQIYQHRFGEHMAYRNKVWKVLTSKFFSKLIAPDASILDLGCGYGEFINNIQAAKKFAMDMNPGSAQRLNRDITHIEQDCSTEWKLPAGDLDAVFTSNFFEHLPSKAALSDTLAQARRCLKEGGLVIAIGPNVRFVGGAYWDFWDHHLPLTNETLSEVLRLHGFRILSSVPRFLPYTMVNQRAVPMLLVALYLKLPFLWRFMGRQFLVVAQKVA